jgi:hypothetical protein
MSKLSKTYQGADKPVLKNIYLSFMEQNWYFGFKWFWKIFFIEDYRELIKIIKEM